MTDRSPEESEPYHFPDEVKAEIERLVELHLRIAGRPPE